MMTHFAELSCKTHTYLLRDFPKRVVMVTCQPPTCLAIKWSHFRIPSAIFIVSPKIKLNFKVLLENGILLSSFHRSNYSHPWPGYLFSSSVRLMHYTSSTFFGIISLQIFSSIYIYVYVFFFLLLKSFGWCDRRYVCTVGRCEVT